MKNRWHKTSRETTTDFLHIDSSKNSATTVDGMYITVVRPPIIILWINKETIEAQD